MKCSTEGCPAWPAKFTVSMANVTLVVCGGCAARARELGRITRTFKERT